MVGLIDDISHIVETDKSSEKNAEMNTVDNPNTPTEIGRDDLRTVLPNYDRDAASAKTSAMILYLAWFVIAACLTLSIYIIVSDGENHLFRKIALPEAGSEGLAFIVNILVTILTDSMGFVHASSLRWALYREERLEFNTNVRLFTSATGPPMSCARSLFKALRDLATRARTRDPDPVLASPCCLAAPATVDSLSYVPATPCTL